MDEFDDRLAECRRRLVTFARRRLPRSDPGLASDYVQDALVEAHLRADLVRALTPEQTYGWLRCVLNRKMANASRARGQAKRNRNRERELNDLAAESVTDPAASPVDTAVRREQ